MKLRLVLILALLVQLSSSQTNIFENFRRKFMVSLVNVVNDFSRFYQTYILREDKFVWNTDAKAEDYYDFIIVGSGSAGSVIANRLSEVAAWKVLVMEAGEPEDWIVDIPLLAMGFQGSSYDWCYRMEKQPNMCLGLEKQRMSMPRGKGLGGSSLLNYMIYSRGNKWDFDEWAGLGLKGWSYEEVLPYFMKTEKATLEKADYRYHNTTGFLSVEDTYQSRIVKAVLDGGEEMGLHRIDYNAPTHPYGVSPVQATTENGKRFTSARAFLQPVSHRKNLDIVTSAFVTKILIDEKTMRAYGIKYEKDGKTFTVRARKEVIVSAGTINTPQLLMLSGIGPKKHLADMGIPCLKDLAVGRNLHDHITFYGVVYLIDFDMDQTTIKYFLSIPDFIINRKGPITTLGGVEGVGFVNTNTSNSKLDRPDIEYMFLRGCLAADHGAWMKAAFKVTDPVYDQFFEPLEEIPSWTISPILLHPKSRGYIELKSKNPYDHPRIYPSYFSDKHNEDIKTFIEAIRVIQRLAKTKAFRKNSARLYRIPVYGCEKPKFDSDEYWECALRSIANTIYHPAGTAKMGVKDDPTAVVDERLRVYGVKGLRVADVSVLPLTTSGHTHAPAMMIGEKVSDIIKDHWLKR